MNSIRLQSSDGEGFYADEKTIKCLNTVRTMVEDCKVEVDKDVVVPLQNVNSSTLRKVLEWAEHHKEDPVRTEEYYAQKRTDDISPWDAEFLNVDQGTLLDLLIAANYLDVRDLLELICKSVANTIKGKTVEEIRQTFNVQSDMSASYVEMYRDFLSKETKFIEESFKAQLPK